MKRFKWQLPAVLAALALCLTLPACGESDTTALSASSAGAGSLETTAQYGDDGRGDLIPDGEGDAPVLMGGALPFTNMVTLSSENGGDGSYYYADMTEDGQIMVVNARAWIDTSRDMTTEDYLVACAIALGQSDEYTLETVEENDEYTESMSYSVYIITYTAGENEDTRFWTVYAMATDTYAYVYGFCETPEIAGEMDDVYADIFARLYLSDAEYDETNSYDWDGRGDSFPSDEEDEVPAWNGRESGSADEYYSGNPDLYQRAISELQGVWYYDGDLSADRYIAIDDAGNWSLYQRSNGNAEGTEMDRGVLSYSDKASTYDATSTWYDGVSYEVFEMQEDLLVWRGEGEFYLME